MAYNNTVHSAINVSTFEALYGLKPFLTPANLLTKISTSAPLGVIAKSHDIRALISEQLKLADVSQTTYHNRRTKPLELAENDFVWLSTTNLSLRNQPCAKFRERFIGPHAISARVSAQAYRLHLPRIYGPHYEFIVDSILDFRIVHSPDDRSHRGPRLDFLKH
jgi:hypothetical protein